MTAGLCITLMQRLTQPSELNQHPKYMYFKLLAINKVQWMNDIGKAQLL